MTYVLTANWPFFKKKELSEKSKKLLDNLISGLKEKKVCIREVTAGGSFCLYDSRSQLTLHCIYHWNDYFYIVDHFAGTIPAEDEHIFCCQLYRVVKGLDDFERQQAAEAALKYRMERVERAYFND